jgi:hypothetical protein
LEGFSDADEADRDGMIDGLSERLGFDVEAQLTQSERDWRERDGRISIQPWMKQKLGLDNPEQPIVIPGDGGAMRKALLKIDGGREYWLEELEIPNTVITEAGTQRSRVNRLMFYSSQSFSARS